MGRFCSWLSGLRLCEPAPAGDELSPSAPLDETALSEKKKKLYLCCIACIMFLMCSNECLELYWGDENILQTITAHSVMHKQLLPLGEVSTKKKKKFNPKLQVFKEEF